MGEPLADVIASLKPSLSVSKLVTASSPWLVRRTSLQQAFYCSVVSGWANVLIDRSEALRIEAGDFLLLPASQEFSMTSLDPQAVKRATPSTITAVQSGAHVGRNDAPVDFQALVGHCSFDSSDASLLLSLLPKVIHAKCTDRLSSLVTLLCDEWRDDRPGREMVLARLMEVLLVEGLRSAAQPSMPPGLLRGLSEKGLAHVLRVIHDNPAESWSIDRLAKEAAMSRSTFFARFSQCVGVAPMQYLQNWRMSVAKALLIEGQASIAQIAERVGYGSATAFSIAFTRHHGIPPRRFGRQNSSRSAGVG